MKGSGLAIKHFVMGPLLAGKTVSECKTFSLLSAGVMCMRNRNRKLCQLSSLTLPWPLAITLNLTFPLSARAMAG